MRCEPGQPASLTDTLIVERQRRASGWPDPFRRIADGLGRPGGRRIVTGSRMLPFLISATIILTLASIALEATRPKRSYRSRAMPDVASEVREGMETLARALCAVAVARHSISVSDHAEKAAVLWIHCANDFRELKVRPETTAWLAKLLDIDPKAMGKQKYGPSK